MYSYLKLYNVYRIKETDIDQDIRPNNLDNTFNHIVVDRLHIGGVPNPA